MDIEIEGIVIGITPIKEKDAMVNVLTKDGRIGFFARSIMNPSSKNHSSCLLYSFSKFTLISKGNTLSLKSGELINSNHKLYNSINIMTSLGIMSELTIRILDENEGRIYSIFIRILELLINGFDSLTLINIFIANIIKLSGYVLNYDCCIYCSSNKNIISLSYFDGGFVCNNCNKIYSNKRYSNDYLKSFRYVFKVDETHYDKVILDSNISKELLSDLFDYLKEKLSIKKFNSKDMFFNLMN